MRQPFLVEDDEAAFRFMGSTFHRGGHKQGKERCVRREEVQRMIFPGGFREKMQQLLGGEFEAFERSYDKPRRRGLRVNESKISAGEFRNITPFPLERIPWVKNGFFYPETVRPARHPYYAAGLYYLQEPSAMTPASRLPLHAGDRVLDLCAAPGGKATELAARLAVLDREATGIAARLTVPDREATELAARLTVPDRETDEQAEVPDGADSETSEKCVRERTQGLLVTNDISQQRAKALLHNLEMTGTDNYCVLNETPERLAEAFPQFFDKILVDAPCSGEGMFRKEEEALRLWSPERVADFARQQKKILEEAYRMLKPGGMLLYSTCTFSPEENEQQIAYFLQQHPDVRLQEIEPYEGFSEGRPDWVKGISEAADHMAEELRKCVRIWPHKMDGEGHFLALMKKQNLQSDPEGAAELAESEKYSGDKESSCADRRKKKQKKEKKKRDTAARPDKEQPRLLREFLCSIVGDAAAEEICTRAEIRQEKAFLPMAAAERLQSLHVMRGGQYIGDWKKNRFEPAQAWAMTLAAEFSEEKTKRCAKNVLSLSPDESALERYLAGESIPAENMSDGWKLVCADKYPVGWVKVVGGVAKNHYPASWRMPFRSKKMQSGQLSE